MAVPEAQECFEKATELDKNNTGAWFNLGLAQRNLKEYNDAIRSYKKVIAIDKENVDAWIGLGITYRHLEDYKEAKECFGKATELEENNPVVWVIIGTSYVKMKSYEEAKRCFEKAIKSDPKYESGIASLIELLIIKGNYGEAFEKARANVDLFKSDEYTFLPSFFVAVSLALQNKHDEFMEWMNKLLRYLQKVEKPWGISWDFSDIRPTLEQRLKKEDMTLISLLIDVFKEEKDLVVLEKELKIKKE